MRNRPTILAVAGWVLAAVFAGLALVAITTARLAVSRTSRVESAPVILAVRKVARLATVEIAVSDVVRYEEVKSFLIFDFPKSAVLRLRGRVLGGFDLDAGHFQVLAQPDLRLVRIAMPAPGILAVDPRFEWFDEKSGIFNPITPEDRNRWMLWARAALVRSAREAGIQAKSEEQARRLLEGAVEALGWKAQVSFAPPAAVSAPGSALPPE